MKIDVTYETADITRLIRQDLTARGIPVNEMDIKYSKGRAVVQVEVTPDELAPAPTAPVPVDTPTPLESPPTLEAIDGGANPVDMTDVLRRSQQVAATKRGTFPAPTHKMLDGESTEFPGDKR